MRFYFIFFVSITLNKKDTPFERHSLGLNPIPIDEPYEA